MVVTEYQGGNDTYTMETRQEGGRASKISGLLDWRYLKGIPGLLKAFEAVSHVTQHYSRRLGVEGLRPYVVGESTTIGWIVQNSKQLKQFILLSHFTCYKMLDQLVPVDCVM